MSILAFGGCRRIFSFSTLPLESVIFLDVKFCSFFWFLALSLSFFFVLLRKISEIAFFLVGPFFSLFVRFCLSLTSGLFDLKLSISDIFSFFSSLPVKMSSSASSYTFFFAGPGDKPPVSAEPCFGSKGSTIRCGSLNLIRYGMKTLEVKIFLAESRRLGSIFKMPRISFFIFGSTLELNLIFIRLIRL